MSKITLECNEQNQVIMSTDPMPFELFMQIMFTGVLHYMNYMVDNAKNPKVKETLKEKLYDALNVVASNTLSQFAPELELRPNLTAQAILEKENEILSRVETPAPTPKDNRDEELLKEAELKIDASTTV